ncbi:hypothetical protein HMPREF9094_0341 [Fusobacterium animalis ATCC 51191]|uniref:Uncharacterized protein n=1 Tax=Fusobacterium animalis ATCC 51191 TaxID=997347 RepID=F9EK87_9FUSO|nr:hypothetical protein HMPREF9094_0341 [Fusobacterium animalis ATCC 51191]
MDKFLKENIWELYKKVNSNDIEAVKKIYQKLNVRKTTKIFLVKGVIILLKVIEINLINLNTKKQELKRLLEKKNGFVKWQ